MMMLSRFRFALLALVACSDTTTNPATQKNLDRPVDVAFACYGGLRITNGNAPTADQEVTSSAQPIDSCVFRSGERLMLGDPPPKPSGQEDIGMSKTGGASWYAFVLQSGPGTVAIARFETKPWKMFTGSDVDVLDSTQLTPGMNGISVGEDPIAIVTDKVGCFEVIANQGSCDLSTLDVNSVFQPPVGADVPKPIVRRMEVKNALGEPIRARPAAMVFEPPGGVIGVACPAQPTGLAYIAYPSCHLVAGVDVSTGTIVTGIQYDAAGVPTVVDGNVTCPAECDGAPPTPGIRPVALDLEKDPRMGRTVLAIGADNSNMLDVYDLDLQTSFPLSLSPIELQNTTGRLGITSVAVTPLIGMGGTNGSTTGIIDDASPGGDHQFVYAVANDGSVRVADLTGAPRECDAQIDPRYLHDVRDVDQLSCLAVKVADQTCTADTQCPTNFCNASAGKCTQYPRRAGARGPGIELIGDDIPTSVEVSRSDKIEGDTMRMPGTPLKLIGYFGMITSASGRAYIFNVDNDDYADYVTDNNTSALTSQIPLDIAHQLKDAYPLRGMLAEESGKFICDATGPEPDASGGNSGGPRLGAPIQRSIPAGFIAQEKVGGLPSLRQVFCDAVDPEKDDRPVPELFFSAPVDVREEVFPDLRALRSDETWTITYEGSLSNDKADSAVDGPAVRTSQLFIDGAGMHLTDNSRPFCDAGVEQFDVVQMRGCDPAIGDQGCPIGYTCYVHPQSQVTGIGSCMLVDEAERLSNACKPFLTTLRRYTVSRTKSGELMLLPRKSVLRTTPLSGCDTDAQCELLADYAAQNASSLNPGDPDQPTDPKTWRCLPDPDRKPVTTGKRCLNVCMTDLDCGFGTVCQTNPAATPQTGFCMEGVTPPQACVNAPQRYELHAGDAFAVLGNLHGYVHPIVADASGSCVRDPNANPLQIGRIPLDAPACDPNADPRTGRRANGTYDPNPCKATVKETEYQFNFVAGTCTLGTPDESIVTRDATALRFRNNAMVMTMVDPTYQGDALCDGDRQGTFIDVPLVMSGYQIAFRQTAGFSALRVPGIAPALPIKVLRGPTDSFWIVDEGDFLSTSISQSSTRGKVYRVESRAIGVINILE